MPTLLEQPPETDANPFSDLIPSDSLIGGDDGTPAYQNIAGKFSPVPKAEINTPTDYGAFSDLVPQEPNSLAQKALEETPDPEKMSDLERLVLGLGPKKTDTSLLHQTLNAVNVFGNAAGRYLFNGLQGWEIARANELRHPSYLGGVPRFMLPPEKEAALEQQYVNDTKGAIPEHLANAEALKKMGAEAEAANPVDPALAHTKLARLSDAAGQATMMGLESLVPGAGLPLMTLHGAMSAEAEAKNRGATDQQAEAAAVRSAIGLAIFGGVSKLASVGVAALLPEGVAPLTKFVSQFVGQEAANETSSRAIGAWEAAATAPEGQKVQKAVEALGEWNLESGTLNSVYALMHAAKAAGARPETPMRPVESSEPAPAATSGSVEQRPQGAEPAPGVAPENRDAGAMPLDQAASPPGEPMDDRSGRSTPTASDLPSPVDRAAGKGGELESRTGGLVRPDNQTTQPSSPYLSRDQQRSSSEPTTSEPNAASQISPERELSVLPPDELTLATATPDEHATKLKLKANKEGGFVNADLLSEAADFGKKVFRKGMDFARWAGEMIRHLGEKIKPHLKGIWDSFTGKDFLPKAKESGSILNPFQVRKVTPLDEATMARSEKLQRSSQDASKAEKIFSRVPVAAASSSARPKFKPVPENRRNAISIYAEAAGDKTVLANWAANAKGAVFRKAAKDAITLSPDEIQLAGRARNILDVLHRRAMTHDVMDAYRDNYIPHMWDLDKGVSKLGGGGRQLQQSFRHAKARSFDTFFDGDQAGLVPKTLDIAKILPAYLTEMNKVIADRQFVQDIAGKSATDGTPLAVPRGLVKTVDTKDGGKIYLANPDAALSAKDSAGNPIDTKAYRVMPDQPALSKWLWKAKDAAGNPIFMRSDLALHPEAHKRLTSMVGADERGTARKIYGKVSSAIKREMFSFLAPFHQVQEGTHAVGHLINPFFGLKEIDFKNPRVQNAVKSGGLMLLHEGGSYTNYIEGVGADRSLLTRGLRKTKVGAPLADVAEGYQKYLFNSYIPRLKYTTYEHILSRNMKRFRKELASGKVSEGDVKLLSGEQTNAAYGHLNYALLDRNPRFQRVLSDLALAPDFLEARGRFVGQAAKGIFAKSGREQFRAVAVLAGVQAGSAFLLSKLIPDADWDASDPFALKVGSRKFTMRSVPEDVFRLTSETVKMVQGRTFGSQFISARINPLLQSAIQAVLGYNYRGEKVSAGQTLLEAFGKFIPITLRQIPGAKWLVEPTRGNPVSPLEQLAGSLGLKISRASPITDTYELANKWKRDNNIELDKGSYPVSKYQQMRYALEDGDFERARTEYQKLIDAGERRTKISEGFRESTLHPFTGSQASDLKFKKSLDSDKRAMYDFAVKKRHDILKRFQAMRSQSR